MMQDNILIILGGGCAGLSLALRLASGTLPYKKVIILERRETYHNDRTWCFWEVDGTYLTDLAEHQWPAFKISSGTLGNTVDCSSTPYQMIKSIDFYDYAIETIRQSSDIELHLGHDIKHLHQDHKGAWVIETDRGSHFGSVVIDTRPEKLEDTMPILWQSFFGQEVSCSAKIFDESIPDLMRFLPSFDDGVAFSYILPFSETEGLLETTVFGPQRLTIEDLKARQNNLVGKITKGKPFEIVRSEYGALPMGHFKTDGPVLSTYFNVGNTSGSLRPSTGFAFQRIQKWAEACATNIRNGSGPLHYAQDRWHIRMMDYLFLRVIREAPGSAPTLFSAIFKTVRHDRVIRFLSDRGTWRDCVAIILALPSMPFFRMLWKDVTAPNKGPRS